MDALVADIAVAGVPEPVPVVLESQFVERTLRRRPQEQVPVHARRHGAVLLVSDRTAALEAQSLGHVNLTDEAALHGLHRPDLERHAAVLRTDLHDALGFIGHLRHPQAFMDVVAGRLFAVDVLARLTGPDGGQCVPVVGGGDGNGVDAGIGEQLTHVLDVLDLLAAGDLLEGGLGLLAGSPVDVAEPGDARVGQARVGVQMTGAAAAKSYDGDVDLVVGAPNARCGGGGHRAEKKPAGSWIRHRQSPPRSRLYQRGGNSIVHRPTALLRSRLGKRFGAVG